MKRTVIVLALLLPLSAMAQEVIPQHGGKCPPDYYAKGGYCYPHKGAKPMIRKSGNACPSGWRSYGGTGEYCTKD